MPASRADGDGDAVRLLAGLASAVIVLVAMRAAAAVVVPLLVALVITAVVAPAQTWLARLGLRPGTAFVLTALAVAGGFGALVWLTYTALSDFLASLPSYAAPLDRLAVQLYDSAEAVGLNLRALAPPPQPHTLLPVLASETRMVLTDVTGGWVLVLAITLFMLYEARTFAAKLRRALGDGAQLRRVEAFGRELATSMGTLSLTNLMVAVGDLIVLVALGVPNAFLWAALSFLLNYIPDVGFIVSVIPPTVATLLHHGPLAALAVLVAFIVINGVIDEIVYPRMLGASLDLAPFWTLVSLVFWGWLLGIAGAILAIPLTMIVKLVLDSFDATRPLSVMLTTGRPKKE